jgi:FADH2 O2-dependent halogenase
MTLTAVERVDGDVAVVGSGFAGSLIALALRRMGRRVVLIERGRHPRWAIGESSTPLANLLLEEIADRYELTRIRPFAKWGTWQAARPDIAGGLKRGFTFYFHSPGETLIDDAGRSRQLMVAASPHDAIGDTHWYRSEFDQMLVAEAQREGAIYLDETDLNRMEETPAHVVLEGVRGGRSIRATVGFVVDASGPRGFLWRALGLEERPFRWLPATEGLFTHFADVDRFADVLAVSERPPYPPDAAALHHVFPGGWIWVLRFNNGVTSAGAALTRPLATAVGAAAGESGWTRLLATVPSVAAQFRRARPLRPFVHAPQLAVHAGQICGARWALLPSAAGVIDPLLSTGFPLTLLGILRLLDILERTNAGDERAARLRGYAQATHEELDVTEQLVAALYSAMGDPDMFKRVALLYFAAASYAETARRLHKPELAPGFLLSRHPRFGAELRGCAELARRGAASGARAALFERLDRAIEPFDVAGLLDRTRRSWYPALAGDLVAAAPKLDVSAAAIVRLLERTGFSATRDAIGR